MSPRNISVRLDIAPAGKGRPRAFAVGGKARLHPDPRSDALEEQIAIMLGRIYTGPIFNGPVGVKISAVLARPGRLFRRADADGRLPAPVKPDADNVAKLLLDALQRCRTCGRIERKCMCGAFFPLLADDAIVCRLVVEKWRGAIRDRPKKVAEPAHIDLRIAEIDHV